MFDVTLSISKDNPVWEWVKHTDKPLISQGHIGTHIDVYKQTEVPLDYFKTRAIVIDCTTYNKDEEIGLDVIKDVSIGSKDFIMFKTDMQSRYPYGDDVYVHQHYQLSEELIQYLINHRVAFIGIDCAGLRRGADHVKVDKLCEQNNVFVIENLDLSSVKSGSYQAYTMWINIPSATGLSTRVILESIPQ